MTGNVEFDVGRILGETLVRHVDCRFTTLSTNTDALRLTRHKQSLEDMWE